MVERGEMNAMSDDSRARISISSRNVNGKARLSNNNAKMSHGAAAATPHRSNSLPTTTRIAKRSSLKRANTMYEEPKRVRFGTIDIHEHPVIPSDNPGGCKGPPVTIDWNHSSHVTAHVQDYEKMRPPRRTATELIMPSTYRQKLLQESGFSLNEIQQYTKKANIARRQRKKTAEMSHMSGISETTEKLTRGLSNLTLNRGKKQKERAFMRKSVPVEQESMEMTEETSLDEETDELILSA